MNPKITTLSVLPVTLLAVGLLATGCGQNQALDENVESEPLADTAAPSPGQASGVEPQDAGLDRESAALRAPDPQPTPAAPQKEEEDVAAVVRDLEARLARAEARAARSQAPAPAPVVPAVRKPAPAPEPEMLIRTVTLPASLELTIEFQDGLSSQTNAVGDPVRALVYDDVVQDGFVAIPAGSAVLGTVSDVVAQKKIGGQAKLAVDFDRIELPSGETLSIQAYMDAEGKGQTKKDAATIGGSTAGGAILGRVLSKKHKDRGTALGAVVGAAVGTAVARRNNADPIVIAAGEVSQAMLASPVEVAVKVRPDSVSVADAR